MTITVGWYADRSGRRGLSNIVVSFLGIVGFSMLLGSTKPGVKYAGTFLGAMGIYPCESSTISFQRFVILVRFASFWASLIDHHEFVR
jgi:hypothetical protein